MNSTLATIARDSLSLGKSVDNFHIKTVVIGTRYTGILLTNGSMGISYTLLDSNTEKDDQIRYLGNKILSEKSLRDLIYYCSSKLGIDRTVGLAALNAYSQANILLDTQIGKDVKDLFLSKGRKL